MTIKKLLSVLKELDELYYTCSMSTQDNMTIEVDIEMLMELIEDIKELILKVNI